MLGYPSFACARRPRKEPGGAGRSSWDGQAHFALLGRELSHYASKEGPDRGDVAFNIATGLDHRADAADLSAVIQVA